MRKCREDERERILEYIGKEKEINTLLLGMIENFGVDCEQLSIYVNEKSGRWDSLIAVYFDQIILYSQSMEYELMPVAEQLKEFDVDCILGKAELVSRLKEQYTEYALNETYLWKCSEAAIQQEELGEEAYIRKIEKEEIPRIVAFYSKSEKFGDAFVGKEDIRVRQQQASMEHGDIAYGVFVDKELAAVARTSGKASSSAVIVGVCVQEKYKKKGYARALVIKICKELFEEGKKYVCIWHSDCSTGNWAEKLGFHMIGDYAMLQRRFAKKKDVDDIPYKSRRLQWTDTYEGYKIRPGFFEENGAMVVPGGVNFTISSRHATYCELLLFRRKVREPFAIIPFPNTYRIGYVYSMIVFDLDIGEFEYAYRFDGPYNPKKGLIFNKEKVVLDPYAKAVTGQSKWGEKYEHGNLYHARVVVDEFDWDDSKQPEIPMEDLVIYELHVRGFTKHDSSGVRCPGTFEGLMEKIPYLKSLGVNAVELMPIFEFDEMKDYREVNGKQLLDYWGYNPVAFFAPNTSYASSLEYNHEGNELKTLICELNCNGIEVILDVVFNHTAEGNEYGPYISYKGVDNNVYYMLTPDGYYYNFSGCGNTLNCNHPVVQRMILDCLRYWVTEYRVDGFRFDLASILGRNEDGTPMENPPLLQSLAYDPILGKVKLIAEAWDAGGMYQVGSFPSWQRWSEWNGKYRDDLRRFLKGDGGLERTAANRILGSLDLYDPAIRGDGASVNFITCHDGFTLWDLYSYNNKHNEDNGWNNEDGDNNNNSWNCGVEGETEQKDVLQLRKRLIKNACVVLLASRGIPMVLAGDEFGNTQFGNNNAYCQDNDISWLDWSLLTANHDIFKFYKFMMAFRKMHPIIRRNTEESSLRFPLTSLHGLSPWYFDEQADHHYVGILYAGRTEEKEDDFVYVAVNTYWESRLLTLPKLSDEFEWTVCVDTQMDMVNGFEPVEGQIRIEPRSVMIFVAVLK